MISFIVGTHQLLGSRWGQRSEPRAQFGVVQDLPGAQGQRVDALLHVAAARQVRVDVRGRDMDKAAQPLRALCQLRDLLGCLKKQ
jgi:hypothetical protein